jgi:CRP/FNR family transcriptional regulator
MNHKPTESPPANARFAFWGNFASRLVSVSSDVSKVDTLVKERVHLQKGESLYRHGDPLSSVYSVRFGTLKTEYCLQDGRQQVIGFHLPGEILGLDGIGDGRLPI